MAVNDGRVAGSTKTCPRIPIRCCCRSIAPPWRAWSSTGRASSRTASGCRPICAAHGDPGPL